MQGPHAKQRHVSVGLCVRQRKSTLPALMLHKPHNAPLYVITPSMPKRRIAPDHDYKEGEEKGWSRR